MININAIAGYSIMAAATLLSLVFYVIWHRGSKNQYDMTEPLDSKEHPLKDFYGFGLEILDLIHYPFKTPWDRKMIENCRIVYGERYAEYYYRIFLAQVITIPYMILVLSLILTVILGEGLILCLGIFLAAGVGYYFYSLISDVIHARTAGITSDFPEVLSKLALLVNAGMIMKEAWEKIAETGEGVLYQEMSIAIDEMRNGVPEIEAYLGFSRRCGQNEISKFTSTLVQNLSKGNKELVDFLKLYAAESWELRKHEARRKGEEASSKLLLPIGLMFGGLMIMVIVPIMSNLAF